jgi:hypothetical protein
MPTISKMHLKLKNVELKPNKKLKNLQLTNNTNDHKYSTFFFFKSN